MISPTDLALVFGLPFIGLLSCTVPERHWPRAARAFGDLADRLHLDHTRSMANRIRQLAGETPVRDSASDIAKYMIAVNLEENLQLLKSYHPKGWRPAVHLIGQDHIGAALDQGRGAVLWIGHFAFSSLLTKITLHGAGIASSHLSHVGHGFSEPRFGMRFLNPIRTSMENRYLRERVYFSAEVPAGGLRTLYKRLSENGVISINVREMARRAMPIPFLDGRLPLGMGAPDLAHAAGAPILPVVAIRNDRQEFEVIVESPIEADRNLSRKSFSHDVARAYVARLEPYVARYPEQWRGWLYLTK